MNWFHDRWQEPESRAAVAGLLGTVSGWVSGTVDERTALMAVFTCVLAFILPGSKPK